MYREEFNMAAQSAQKKSKHLKKNPAGYFLLSMLAGMYIGFAVLLVNTIGGTLHGAVYTKTAMGLAFGVALSLVVMAGAELFTGNNLTMSAGVVKKTVTVADAVKLWIVCYLGNFIGSMILAGIFHLTQLDTGATGQFLAESAAAKMSPDFLALFARGLLCNVLVCLATWSGYRCKSESGKLIMIFWCLFAFITTGFEHSVANMTLFASALIQPMGQAVSVTAAAHNLVAVTLGNMVGGIVFVMIPYFIASRETNG